MVHNRAPAYIAPANTPPTITCTTPMLLSQRREPFDGDDWLFEPKWTGWRCIAVVRQAGPYCSAGTAMTITARFSAVVHVLRQLPDGTVIDGELVFLDGDGYPDLSALMRRQGAPSLLTFDVLALAGRNRCGAPIGTESAAWPTWSCT